jgi:hypothetical protein
MIVVCADAIVDVRIEHRAVGRDGDDHDDVDVLVSRRVCRPVRRGLQAHVGRNDRVSRLRDASDQQ